MLTAIRENSKGWIAGIIIGAIVLTFALFGISSYLEGANEIPVATVNGEEISIYTYQNELARQSQLLRSQLGSNFDPQLLESLNIRNQVVESLVSNRLLNQYVTDQNYRISDQQLSERIRNNPAFQSDGQFDAETYRNILASNGLSAQGFEAMERQSGIASQLRQSIADSSFVLNSDIDKLAKLQQQIRVADYVVIPGNKFYEEIEVADGEIQTYFDENADDFQTEARIKVDYIELSVESLAEEITPSEDDVQEIWDYASGQYKTAESRKASHILFSVRSSATDEEKQAVREKAEGVLQQARAGADFAELASTHSEDPGSSSNGGDLGVIAEGQMVKPFEDAVFSMEQDQISDLIETRFGFHIIKLTELVAERQQSLDEVREEIVAEAKRVQAENLYAELGESFQNLVFEQPDSLQGVADELGLEIKTSGWFTQNAGGGIAQEAAVRRAAFGEDVLEDNLNSQAIEIGFERMISVRKSEYEESRPNNLDEVRARITDTLKRSGSIDRVVELGSSWLDTAKASGLEAIEDDDALIQTLPESRTEIPAALRELGDAIYAASPGVGAPVIDGLAMDNGDYAIFVLSEVKDVDAGDIDETVRTRLRQQLLSRNGNSLYQNMSELLRDLAEVSIDSEQLTNDDFAQGGY